MTLLDRILARGFEFPSDPIMTMRLERHARRIQPDPMFRRRLRSVVVNRYVATREGLAPVPVRAMPRRQMGALGRGVLYASLLTAVSVSAVGAASDGTMPGDALYGVKLQLEQLRLRIAPPSLHDDLAAMALNERLDEVEALAGAGRWELVDDAAALVAEAEAALVALVPDPDARAVLTASYASARHAQRLAQLMATAPASALGGLQMALDASTSPRPSSGSGAGGQDGQDAQLPGTNAPPHDPRGTQAVTGPQFGGGTQDGGHTAAPSRTTTASPSQAPAATPSVPPQDQDEGASMSKHGDEQ